MVSNLSLRAVTASYQSISRVGFNLQDKLITKQLLRSIESGLRTTSQMLYIN